MLLKLGINLLFCFYESIRKVKIFAISQISFPCFLSQEAAGKWAPLKWGGRGIKIEKNMGFREKKR